MKITPETLHKMAHLARLEVRPDEETGLLNSLNSVLDWMAHLDEVDTTGVAPLMHMSEETANVFRPDEVQNQLPRQQALVNAPDHDNQFVKVPKVLD